MKDTSDSAIDLGEREQQVLAAVARLEAEGRPTYAPAVAAAAGLPDDETRQALHELTSRHNLVREVADDPGSSDLGPQYEVRQPS